MTSDRIRSSRNRFKAWMQLLRLPNLFTVPGDPLAGFLLAYSASSASHNPVTLLWPVFAATLLYMAGLISNDLADQKEDARERPDRPIPSGRISPHTAWCAFLLLTLTGELCAWMGGLPTFLYALLLLALILLYNFAVKNIPVIGPLCMGACRGVSVLLGAVTVSALPTAAVITAALMITGYIAAVTLIASRETQTESSGRKRWAPGAVLLSGWICFYLIHPFSLPAVLCAAASFGRSVWFGKQLTSELEPTRTPRLIGALIRNLLLMQAAWCACSYPYGRIAAVLLLMACPISCWTSKAFYSS